MWLISDWPGFGLFWFDGLVFDNGGGGGCRVVKSLNVVVVVDGRCGVGFFCEGGNSKAAFESSLFVGRDFSANLKWALGGKSVAVGLGCLGPSKTANGPTKT